MRTLNKRSSNYKLVYSTKDLEAGSRDGNAGDRPSRKSSGSRRGGAGAVTGKTRSETGANRSENYTPSDVVRKQQEIRKRGEDKKGEQSENKR